MRAAGTLDTSCQSSVLVCKEANARSPSYWWPLVGKFLPSLHVKPREHRRKTPTSWVQWEAPALGPCKELSQRGDLGKW